MPRVEVVLERFPGYCLFPSSGQRRGSAPLDSVPPAGGIRYLPCVLGFRVRQRTRNASEIAHILGVFT